MILTLLGLFFFGSVVSLSVSTKEYQECKEQKFKGKLTKEFTIRTCKGDSRRCMKIKRVNYTVNCDGAYKKLNDFDNN